MGNKDLLRKPHFVNPNFWWYEEPGGISIVIVDSGYSRIEKIPWKAIRAALERKDRK